MRDWDNIEFPNLITALSKTMQMLFVGRYQSKELRQFTI